MVKSLKASFVTAVAVAAILAALPQDLQAQARNRGGGGGRPPSGGGAVRSAGGPTTARAVPRSQGNRPGGPYGPGVRHGGGHYGGHHYYGRPYGAAYYPGYAYWPVGVSVGFAFGYGGFGWYGGVGYPAYGYGYPGYYGYPGFYGYPYYGYPGYAYAPYRPYGGVRIQLPQRQAEVWVGGYFVGTVDDFDGSFQQLNLEPGAHRIEVREPGFDPIAFDVKVEPGRTIHYRSDMKPVP